jgi:chitosanase
MLKIFLVTITLLFFIACGGGSSSNDLKPLGDSSGGLTSTQRLIADQFISIFENGTVEIKYDYAEDIHDGRGITAGRAGFTSGTGDMLMVIKRYTEKKPDNTLAVYIPELERLFALYKNNGYKLVTESANITNLVGLEQAWDANTEFEEFIDVQFDLVNELYYYPSVEMAKKEGLVYPLSILVLYDSYIQHGKNGVADLITTANTITGLSIKDGADELTWLRNFVKNRKVVLESDSKIWNGSINRVIELMDLIDAKNINLEPFELKIKYPSGAEEIYNLPVR